MIKPDEVEDALKKMGIDIVQCRQCGIKLIFLRTKKGRNMPVTLELKSHFADCPNATQFRKLL